MASQAPTVRKTDVKGLWEARAIEQLAACLALTGQRARLERLLATSGHPGSEVSLRYFLGLSCAREEKLEQALEHLRVVIALQPDHSAARKLASRLLLHQAGVLTARRDWDGVSRTLTEAVRWAPADEPSIQRELACFSDVLPMAYIRAGNRDEAARAWERQICRESSNCRVLHNLAVLYYWWARKQEDDKSCAQPPWEPAIAFWAATLNTDSYWQEFQRQRDKAWGFALEERDLDSVRESFLEEYFVKPFDREISDCVQRGDQANRRRLDDCLTSVLLERQSSRHWNQALEMFQRKLGSRDPKPWARSELLRIPGGYLFFEHFGLLSDVAAAISQLSRLAADAECLPWLRIYFSPAGLGRIAVLIDERNRPEDALALLAKLPAEAGRSIEASFLRTRAQSRKASRLFERGEALQALEDWQAVNRRTDEVLAGPEAKTPLGAMFRKLREELDQEAVKAVESEATRLDKEEKLDEAIKLLEQAVAMGKDGKLKDQLCVLHCNRGRKSLPDKRYSQAREDFQRALKLQPNHETARALMSLTYNNEGCDLDDADRSIALFEKALEWSADNYQAKQNLAAALNGKAVAIVNGMGAYPSYGPAKEAVDLLKRAARLLKPDLETGPIRNLGLLAAAGPGALESALEGAGSDLYKRILTNLGMAQAILGRCSRY